jgi:hypothetical protein
MLLAVVFAATPLQVVTERVASAAETGTWVDGAMPELVVGGLSDNPFPSHCYMTTFYYHSYTKPNGQHDPIGRRVPIDACARRVGFGHISNWGSAFIKPETSIAFRVFATSGFGVPLIPNPGNASFFVAPIGPQGLYLALYDKLGQAGSFEPYNGMLAYKLKPVTADYYLVDSAKNRIEKMPPIAFSSSGEWVVIEARGLGFLRINTLTREMLLFDTTRYRYGIGLSPNVMLAVSGDDGKTVIRSGIGALAPQTVVFDLSDCQISPFTAGASSNSIEGCRSRSVHHDLVTKHPGYVGMFNMRFNSDGKSIRAVAAIKKDSDAIEYHNVTYSVAGYKPPKVSYLALGDSFSSGEGDLDDSYYLPETNTSSNKCHVSMRSYSYLVSADMGIEDFYNVACSGARYDPHYSKGIQYRDPLAHKWLAGSKSQSTFLSNATPDVVTISMVGNDIGFKGKILRCLAPDSCLHFKEDRQSVVEEINSKFDDLVSMYLDIKEKTDNGKVYVLGYPKIFATNGDCRLGVNLDPEERRTAQGLVGYLNAVIKAATEKAGVQYIDVEHAFAGHELCSGGKEAVNGLSHGDDILLIVGNESFHPNHFGHQLLAGQLLAQSQDFTKSMPAPNSGAGIPSQGSEAYHNFIGDAPSGGVLKRISFVGIDSARILIKHNPFDLGISDLTSAPNSPFEVWFNSEPVYAGTLMTDETGDLSGQITVPDGIPPGFHTMYLKGKDIAGQHIELYDVVYVAESATDFDGDGILNEDEKCLAVEPANVDEDRDGIDDACDPEVTEAPADTAPPEVTGTPNSEPNGNGWYKSDVTINWSAADPEPSSGEPTQPPATVASLEGVHTYASEESCDPLGNCAAGSLELRIDKIAPGITYTLSPSPTVFGWNNSAVTVTFDCSDASSGVASCTEPQTVGGTDGTYVITGMVTDKAGNTSGVNVFVSLDRTAPTVTQNVSPAANFLGWHNTDVTVTPACGDNLSGILECGHPVTVSTEGANQIVESSTKDSAGNTATASTSLNIDKTAPALGAPSWDNNPKSIFGTATIAIPATDNLSGIAEAEYYLGDFDPGEGNGATMQVNDGNVSVTFGTDFPTGVYKVTMRAEDKAGNCGASRSVITW